MLVITGYHHIVDSVNAIPNCLCVDTNHKEIPPPGHRTESDMVEHTPLYTVSMLIRLLMFLRGKQNYRNVNMLCVQECKYAVCVHLCLQVHSAAF